MLSYLPVIVVTVDKAFICYNIGIGLLTVRGAYKIQVEKPSEYIKVVSYLHIFD